jgi:hypothetical protein
MNFSLQERVSIIEICVTLACIIRTREVQNLHGQFVPTQLPYKIRAFYET